LTGQLEAKDIFGLH